MRKLLLSTLLLFASLSVFSQSADKGLFTIKVGAGAGLLTTTSNDGGNNKGYALPTILGLEFGYTTHDRVSLGLDAFSHTYSADDTSVISIGGGALGIDLHYFLTNKEKSNTFIGTTIGIIGLQYNAYNYPDSGSVDSVRKDVWSEARGIYNKVYLGYNRYFGNTFGLYIKAGFMNIPLRMKYVTVDDVEVDYIDKRPIDSWNALFRGGFVNFGLTFKLGGKKSKKVEDEPKE